MLLTRYNNHSFIIDINTIIFVALIITFEQTGGHCLFFAKSNHIIHAFHHPLKYFINLSTCKNGNSFNFHQYFDISAIHYKLRFNIFTVLCRYNVRISVRFWVETLQYGARCAHIQRNILKDRKRLVEAKLASSKWTNHQPCTVWSLVFAFSVLPACSQALFQQFT